MLFSFLAHIFLHYYSSGDMKSRVSDDENNFTDVFLILTIRVHTRNATRISPWSSYDLWLELVCYWLVKRMREQEKDFSKSCKQNSHHSRVNMNELKLKIKKFIALHSFTRTRLELSSYLRLFDDVSILISGNFSTFFSSSSFFKL